MIVFKHEGKTYEAILELNNCKGCAFDGNDEACSEANLHCSCTINEIIWVSKDVLKVPDDLVSKIGASTFEQKLQELLTEEYSLNNRKVCSIFANEYTLSGKPLALKIEYETNL
jgi:hypothetical protein